MANFNNTTLLDILNKDTHQFVIPIYQRGYNWEKHNIKKLIDDLVEFNKNIKEPTDMYYVGTIITKELPQNNDGQILYRYVIVDGQQRITTTLIFLLALREVNNKEFNNFNDKYFKLKSIGGETRIKIDRLNDANVLKKLIDKTPLTEIEKNTNIYKNYCFAQKYIKENKCDLDLFKGLSKTLLINIRLSSKENENKIFETINSSGINLSDSDLIKNYIFFYSHELDDSIENDLFNEYKVLESKIKDLNGFYRYFASLTNPNRMLASKTKQNDIYNSFKDSVENFLNLDMHKNSDIRELFNRLAKFKKIWLILNEEPGGKNQKSNFEKTLIQQSFGTYFMLFAELMIEFNDELEERKTEQIIHIISKLILFRTITGLPDKNITRDVPNIVKRFKEQVPEAELEDLEDWLLKTNGNYRMPTIEEMLSNIKSYKIYSETKKKTQNILRAYELSLIKEYGSPVDLNCKYTIEHIMPQNFEKKWYLNLKNTEPSKYTDLYEKVHTLGNLTLLTSKMNSSLGSETFKVKVKGNDKNPGFMNDPLAMNKEISKNENWDITQIDSRSEKIVRSIYEWMQ